MAEKSRQIDETFLENLVNAYSPTGSEGPAQKIFREYTSRFVDKVETDVLGNVIAVVNPSGSPKIMLAGHIDEVAMQVRYINDKGFIYFHSLGGLDAHLTPGNRVKILTQKGEILGIIGKKAIHLQEPEERIKVVKLKEQFIDIGVSKREEAEQLGVRIGDPIVFTTKYTRMGTKGIVISRCFDDKIGAFIVAEILHFLKKEPIKAAVYGVATVQEEIGTRGAITSAYSVDPYIGIAYDVTFATDSPDMTESDIGIVTLGGGPSITRGPNINPILFDLFVQVAGELHIPLQFRAASGPTGTDARSIQITRSGVATALVGIPNRYMHSANEVVHLDDVDAIVRLSVEVIKRITPQMSFIPQ